MTDYVGAKHALPLAERRLYAAEAWLCQDGSTVLFEALTRKVSSKETEPLFEEFVKLQSYCMLESEIGKVGSSVDKSNTAAEFLELEFKQCEETFNKDAAAALKALLKALSDIKSQLVRAAAAGDKKKDKAVADALAKSSTKPAKQPTSGDMAAAVVPKASATQRPA